MATGSGKTRTVIALADLLMRANWAKRTLFLADRIALVNQAVKAFKAHLPTSAPINLVTEKRGEGRVYVSTYPTMMGLIDERNQDQRRFGVGHFDLVVIDEAHRSVYQKYGAIFEYFDSLLVGLTATPKDEIDRNTYGLFDLEDGIPTDTYGLDDAVRDKFLVPPKAVSVPLRFSVKASSTRISLKKRGSSGMPLIGMRRGTYQAKSAQKPLTGGSSTPTPSTRCWPL
jgi:type I restriction enzyme R subunit